MNSEQKELAAYIVRKYKKINVNTLAKLVNSSRVDCMWFWEGKDDFACIFDSDQIHYIIYTKMDG